MTKIKAIFFDRDNTLTYFNPAKRQLLHDYILERSGNTYHLPYETMMALFDRAGYPKEGLKSLEAERAFWLRYYKELILYFRIESNLEEGAAYLFGELWCNNDMLLFEESLEVLDFFKQAGLRIGIISDTSPSLQLSLEQMGLGPWIDSYTCADLVGVGKPDPRIYQAALDALGVEAHEALYVDDYDIEADGAREMGFTAFHINRSGDAQGMWVIKSLREMVDYYQQHYVQKEVTHASNSDN